MLVGENAEWKIIVMTYDAEGAVWIFILCLDNTSGKTFFREKHQPSQKVNVNEVGAKKRRRRIW